MTDSPHVPVMLAEVLAALAPRDGEIVVDGTFGAGGYTTALLTAAACRVIAIDRDPTAIARGRELAHRWDGRLDIVEGRFGELSAALASCGVERIDGLALDIGVSSMQLDQADRGFSFAKDGPLDMRMGASGPTAADLVNTTAEADLANLVYRYGEERMSRRVAHAIVEARRAEPFSRTVQLAAVVRRAVPKSKDGIDPATRTFQALRIAVNDELGELERALAAAERVLAPGGRLAVVTFHSLEDRVVKDFLKARSGAAAQPSRHLPAASAAPPPSFTLLSRKAIRPSAEECARNPRARSAKLRAALRTEAPTHAGLHQGDAP